jgi:hypothetical protein
VPDICRTLLAQAKDPTKPIITTASSGLFHIEEESVTQTVLPASGPSYDASTDVFYSITALFVKPKQADSELLRVVALN